MTCIDCPSHKVMPDPDPHDSFCSDDETVLCGLSANINNDTQWKTGTLWPNRPVASSCRPYNKRKEATIPSWCPLDKGGTPSSLMPKPNNYISLS